MYKRKLSQERDYVTKIEWGPHGVVVTLDAGGENRGDTDFPFRALRGWFPSLAGERDLPSMKPLAGKCPRIGPRANPPLPESHGERESAWNSVFSLRQGNRGAEKHTMPFSIPRGIIYHSLGQDLGSLAAALFARLGDASKVREFEECFAAYVGRKHCVAFPYARVAIHNALRAKGISAGSEIIMPPITIKTILDVVLDLGLVPVFVDLDPDTLCFDLEKLRNAITEKTSAVLVTYLYGMVPRLDELMSICQDRQLFTIEDFSQCLNGQFEGKKIGSFGDVGVYSASWIKTLDTYGGGLLVCDDSELHQGLREFQTRLSKPSRVRLIQKIIRGLVVNLATRRFIFHVFTFPIIRLMATLKPGSTFKHTGSRNQDRLHSLPEEWFEAYTSFQAGVGLKLIGEVEGTDEKRIRNAETLRASADTTWFPSGVPGGRNVFWQLVAYFEDPHGARTFLGSRGIDTSTTSLEKISTLPKYPYQGDTPNADRFYTNGLLIPSYPRLSPKDLERVRSALNGYAQR